MKLEEIKALCNAATPGPWFVERGGELRDRHGSLVMADMAPEAGIFNNEADAAFIAAMRSLAPKMLAVCEAAKEAQGFFEPGHYRSLDEALAALEESETP